MAKTVTTRLEDRYVQKIDELAAIKGVDRSALLRSFLVQAIKAQEIDTALEKYGTGAMTLWEAARSCDLSLWDMISEVRRRHIHSSYNLKDLQKDLEALDG